jgi:hypothetical protein
MNAEELRLIWLFCIGVFLSFLFYISEIISQNELIPRLGILKVAILVLTNSLIGGFVMVATFYVLEQFFVEWNEYLKVGISGFVAMAGKDAVHVYHKLLKQKVGGE